MGGKDRQTLSKASTPGCNSCTLGAGGHCELEATLVCIGNPWTSWVRVGPCLKNKQRHSKRADEECKKEQGSARPRTRTPSSGQAGTDGNRANHRGELRRGGSQAPGWKRDISKGRYMQRTGAKEEKREAKRRITTSRRPMGRAGCGVTHL